jgi:hypothetical protein
MNRVKSLALLKYEIRLTYPRTIGYLLFQILKYLSLRQLYKRTKERRRPMIYIYKQKSDFLINFIIKEIESFSKSFKPNIKNESSGKMLIAKEV